MDGQMRILLVIICGALFSFIVSVANGADVTLTMVGNDNALVCDQSAKLTCDIPAYKLTMTFEINNEVAADCIIETCRIYTTSFPNLKFDFDTTAGVFNVTMDPVRLADNGAMIKCDDGSHSANKTLSVIVTPSVDTTLIESSTHDSGTTIKVVTGCVYPSDSIHVTWYHYKETQSPTVYAQKGVMSIDKQGCGTGPCSGPELVRVSDSLHINEDDGGESYYFQARVHFPGVGDTVVTSDRTFKLKNTGKPGEPSKAANTYPTWFQVFLSFTFAVSAALVM